MRDSKDFETFFKESYNSLYFYALRYIRDEELGRDVVHDAFEYVWRNFQDRNADDWFKYAYSFVRNECIDHLRHAAVRKRFAEFYVHSVDISVSPTQGEEDGRMAAIRKIIATLPPRTRLVLQEIYVNKKKYKEVAEELDISVSAVKKHLVKALKTMREKTPKNA